MATSKGITGVEVPRCRVIIAARNGGEKLMADVFTHPWLGGLFGDSETEALLSAEATLKRLLAVEAAYSRALGVVGVVDKNTANETAEHILQFSPDMAELHRGAAEDGVVVPALVTALRTDLPQRCEKALHIGLTSQDVIDTATVMMFKQVCDLFSKRLEAVTGTLAALNEIHGNRWIMGRTRMQAALPIAVSDRLSIWTRPLTELLERLHQQQACLFRLQLGGPVGTRDSIGANANEIADQMADELGLINSGVCWHTNRSAFADFANWLSLVTGALGKIGQDVALMTQQGVDEMRLSGGGRSSAMPHKQNPILAELLVTLARYNATLVSGMHHAVVHEQERSGTAWTLEWIILPQQIMTTGRALVASNTFLEQIETIGSDAPIA